MANQRNEITNIDFLPDEVLCMIFDHLNLESVKHASLCCQRWNNIIFFSSYVRRFAINCDLIGPLKVHRPTDGNPTAKLSRTRKAEMLTQETIRALTQTKRGYRNLKCIMNGSVRAYFPSIWQTVHQQLGNNLHSLEIYSEDRLISRIFTLLADTIPSIPTLSSLALVDFFNHPFNAVMLNAKFSLQHKNKPTLRSNSVRQLQFESTFRFKPDMPKLHSFDGALFALYRPNNPSAFANLTRLTISVDMDNLTEPKLTAVESIFRALTLLEVMIWEIEVSNELFIKVCETCTSLKELHFVSKLNIHYMGMLSLLFNLKNLRSLTFEISCTKYDEPFNFDLSQLTKLETLCMGDVAIDFLGLPESTTHLWVSLNTHDQYVLQKVIRHTQLDKLICRFYGGQCDDVNFSIQFMEPSSLQNP